MTGRPIDPPARVFLEERFQRLFSEVRIHTGPVAQAMAAFVGARAFVCGNDIMFADGEYRPDTAEGLQLLAHELAHICQQPPDPFRGPWRLAPAGGRLEEEAEEAARRILTAAPLPGFTRDAPGVLRRAVTLDLKTAAIDVSAGHANALFSLREGPNRDVVVANLSRGFNHDPNNVAWAFEFTGHVKLKPTSQEDGNQWIFGFVQFIRHGTLFLIYQGRKPDEGHIVMDLGVAIGSGTILDSAPPAKTIRPFLVRPNTTTDELDLATTMGDHPILAVDHKARNFTTGFDNYLMRIVDGRQAISIFSAKQPNGQHLHLAHVEWRLTYDSQFRWRGGEIQPGPDSSSFSVGTPVQGPPPDNRYTGVEASILARLGPNMSPVANEVARTAFRKAVDHDSPHRFDRSGAHPFAPPDFFR